jgi:hypothetical protein
MSHNFKIITGIGSRGTPESIQQFMSWCGYQIAEKGWVLRSGGAAGADKAFEYGISTWDKESKGTKKLRESMEIFLPWKGYENAPDDTEHEYKYKKELDVKAEEIAKRIHPAWHNCSYGAKKMHTRNIYQLLGYSLELQSDYVMCWTPDGKDVGGTRTVITLARELGIPVLNFFYKEDIEKATELLVT